MRGLGIARSFLLVLLSAVLCGNAWGQEKADFAGEWALRLGKRVFLVVSLKPVAQDAGRYEGALIRPKHFSTSGVNFSGISGGAVRFRIVKSAIKENCLSFTTENPADTSDTDDFQLCEVSDGQGTLKLKVPGFEAWPVSREKGPVALATDWDSARSYLLDDTDVSNAEMQRVFEDDQKVRQPRTDKMDWTPVEKTDAERREVTRKLLAEGKLHTGEDFERAAFVFQHGSSPDDYLLAHTLAMVAVAHGRSGAIWISAATLDRYLNSIHQAQIFGTQFYTPEGKPATQEPYNRELISDALRRQLGVPSQAAQEEQRKEYDTERAKSEK